MSENNKNTSAILIILGALLTIWIALLFAPYINDGLVGIINNISNITDKFYQIQLCENSLKTVLFFYYFILLE